MSGANATSRVAKALVNEIEIMGILTFAADFAFEATREYSVL